MSVSCSRAVRGSPFPLPLPAVACTFLLVLATSLVAGSASLAGPTSPVVSLSGAEAVRAGLALRFVTHPELPAGVLEIVSSDAAPARTLLAVAPGGRLAALAEPRGQDPATLVLAAADGGQVRVAMAGLIAAAFGPDATWLAATDGTGRLWKVDAADGSTRPMADGPFTGPLAVDEAGAVLALAVPSVEAPWYAHPVRLSAAGTPPRPVAVEELVYAMQPLADGSLAMVAHRSGTTVLQRRAGTDLLEEVDLGSGAVNVSVSRDFRTIAFEREGRIFVRNAGGPAREVGPGVNPRLSGDGTLLLADAEGGTVAYAADGSVLARLSPSVAFDGCEGCGS